MITVPTTFGMGLRDVTSKIEVLFAAEGSFNARPESEAQLLLTSVRRGFDPSTIAFPADSAVQVAQAILAAVGSDNIPENPETRYDDCTTKLQFSSYDNYQHGRGCVVFEQSPAEKADGRYNPHRMFIHNHAENRDEAVAKQVENECAMLAYLLNRFRILNDYLPEKAKGCEIVPEPAEQSV